MHIVKVLISHAASFHEAEVLRVSLRAPAFCLREVIATGDDHADPDNCSELKEGFYQPFRWM